MANWNIQAAVLLLAAQIAVIALEPRSKRPIGKAWQDKRLRAEDLEIAFQGGAKSFLFKGTNGRWRDVLTPDELAAYAKRVAELLPPDAAAWVERGRAALPR